MSIKKSFLTFFIFFCLLIRAEADPVLNAEMPPAQDTEVSDPAQEGTEPITEESAASAPSIGQPAANPQSIFDDKQQLNGFAEIYKQEPMGILIAMIKDETLDAYRTAAAVRVFRENYIDQVFLRDKIILEKTLLRRLARTDSPFLQVEIMHTLCLMNRYKYFNSMVPALIQKLDHYNSTVNELAFESLQDLTSREHTKAREARIIFNGLRKMMFLSRRKLANIKEPGRQLSQKLELLRWAIKILGTEELNRLPKEVIHLL